MEQRYLDAASAAIAEAWYACPAKQSLMTGKLPGCDCDSSQIDGCKELVAAVARAIAAKERQMKVEIDYTNHRGERQKRNITPISIRFDTTRWHPGPQQWLLDATDENKGEMRTFAMKDIHGWR